METVLLQGGCAPILPPFLLLQAFPIHKKSEGKKSLDGVHIGQRRRMEGGSEQTNRTANKWRDSFVPQVGLHFFSLTCKEKFLHSRKTNGISQLSRQQE